MLITSDIHIHDYPHHNLFDEPKFRLNQFIRLAHRLVEIAKSESCDYIVLGGDIVHRPIVPPETAHTVSQFFEILQAYFAKDNILFIFGQHDLATKNQIQHLKDSIIPVIAGNARYMDQQIINLDGRSIGFRNWTPDQDFTFIEDKVDLMIGHVTLSEMFGQDYDESKYSLGFFGDIHNKSNIKHSHTINVPIPHYISDEQQGSVIVVDIPTLEWKRVNTESESFKHLKMYYDDINVTENEYTVSVKRPTTVTTTEHIHRSINLDEVIAGVVNQSGQSTIHNELSTLVDRSNVEAINLNFVINELRINNFRSIKELTYTPQSGITSITGINGTGKSSLMRAMDFLLRPPKSGKHLVNKSANSMSVFADINYNNIKHTIERGIIDGSGYLKYSKNDEEQRAGSMAELHAMLVDNLPFIKFFDIIYRPQGAPSLLSDYGYTQRIDLVNSLLGLVLISRYYDVANAKVKALKTASKSQEDQINIQLGVVTALEEDFSILTQYDSNKKEYSIALTTKESIIKIRNDLLFVAGINVKLEHANKLLDIFEFDDELVSQNTQELKSKLEDLDSQRLNLIKIADLEKRLAMTNQFRNSVNFNVELANKSTEDLQNNINKGKDIISKFKNDLSILQSNKFAHEASVKTWQSEKVKLENSKTSVNTTCPSCKRALDTSDYEAVLKHIDDELVKVKNKLEELSTFDNVDYDKKVFDLNTNINEAELMINNFNQELNTISSNKVNENQYNELTLQITKLESDISEAKKLVKNLTNVSDCETEINKLKLFISNIDEEIKKKNQYLVVVNEIVDYKQQLSEINISDNYTIESVNIELHNLESHINELSNTITRLEVLKEKQDKFNNSKLELDRLTSENVITKESIEAYTKYSQLFHPTGDVIKSVYLQVATLLSDNDITVRTVKQLASGETRIDFDIDMRVEGWNIPYDDLSGGQKTKVDVYFLTRLFKMSGSVGLLILDETLKDLDSNNLETVAKMLSDSPITSILLSTHVSDFNYYDNRLHTSLVGGYSVYQLEGKV